VFEGAFIFLEFDELQIMSTRNLLFFFSCTPAPTLTTVMLCYTFNKMIVTLMIVRIGTQVCEIQM